MRVAAISPPSQRGLAPNSSRVSERLEQQAIDDPRVALGERVQFMRQREHQMEVRQRQELGAARGKPALFGEGLAFRAMAVQARAIDQPLKAAL